ncbi:MAG: helix-turn-helix domain-containing protein [Planctomycetota bacterium]|nr:helix-turn-helix domain-containing protein [Planctomycetota bacterium]
MPRPRFLSIQSPKQWEVILSPVRGELVQALRCIGPCSTSELAEMLDRPADTLYRHLDALKRAGFVIESGERVRGTHHERLFDLTADDFKMGFAADAHSSEGQQGIAATARAFLGTMTDTIERSAEAGVLELPPPGPNLLLNYEVSWLTPAEFKKARALMFQLKQLMDKARPRRAGKLYASVAALCPVTRKRRPSRARPTQER